MAALYGILYLVWLLFWGINFGILLAVNQGRPQRQMWRMVLWLLGLHLLVFVPTVILVARSEIYYDLSQWLSATLPWAKCPQPGYQDERVFNRAAAMLLSTSSWLYQWPFVGLWLIWQHMSLPRQTPAQQARSQAHQRGILAGAGLLTFVGGLFALGLLLHGFRCGVGGVG